MGPADLAVGLDGQDPPQQVEVFGVLAGQVSLLDVIGEHGSQGTRALRKRRPGGPPAAAKVTGEAARATAGEDRAAAQASPSRAAGREAELCCAGVALADCRRGGGVSSAK